MSRIWIGSSMGLAALVALLLPAAAAGQDTPRVPQGGCQLLTNIVPDVFTLSPDGSFAVSFQVVTSCGPVAGAAVDVEFSADATALIAWTDPVPAGADVPAHPETTPGEPYRAYRAVTDANGMVEFHIAAGGCVDPERFTGDPFVLQVRTDNVFLAEIGVNSPDAVNAQGQLATDLGHSICLDGHTEVGLADASFHAPAITQGLVEYCSRFTAPYTDPVGLADAAVLADYVTDGAAGTCN